MTYYFKHPTLDRKHKIRNNYYMQLQEIYTKTKTSLQFIDDNHTRNYNRVLHTLSYNRTSPSDVTLSKTDIQNFLNKIKAEYTIDCQMATYLKQRLQKNYEIYQTSGLNIEAINELLTTDSQAQKQLDQLLTTLTNTLNAK